MGLTMKTKTALRSLGLLAIAAGVAVIPQDAMAAIAQTADVAMAWADEIVIVAAVVGALVVIDMTSWSLMTPKK